MTDPLGAAMLLGWRDGLEPLVRLLEVANGHVLAVSPEQPGMGLDWIRSDIRDVDRIISEVENRGLSIRLVVTHGSDVGLIAQSELEQRLQLEPSLNQQLLLKGLRKIRDDIYHEEVGISSIPSVATIDAVESDWSRIVVKPNLGQGQLGVQAGSRESFMRDPDRVKEVRDVSWDGEVVFQPFVAGDEITIHALMHGGLPRSLVLSDRLHFPSEFGIGICGAHFFPSRYSAAIWKRATRIATLEARRFGLTDGPLYVQVLLSHGHLYVVESTPRWGGGREETVLEASGIPAWKSLMSAIDPSLEPTSADRTRTHHMVGFFALHAGLVHDVRLPSHRLPEVLHLQLSVRPGEHGQGLRSGTDRVGYAVISGPSVNHIRRTWRAVTDEIIVTDESGRNLLIAGSLDGLEGRDDSGYA